MNNEKSENDASAHNSSAANCYTHFTWDIEENGKCPKCKGDTILIYPANSWAVDEESCSEEDYENELIDGVDVSEEITAHFCFNCNIITSLSFNKY